MGHFDTDRDNWSRHLSAQGRTPTAALAVFQGTFPLPMTSFPANHPLAVFGTPTSEFDTEDRKPSIDWNKGEFDKWAAQTSKLSPSDAVRTATPSAHSTESTPSSQRQSIGPDDETTDETPLTPEGSAKTDNSEVNGELKAVVKTEPKDTVSEPNEQSRLAALKIAEKIHNEQNAPQAPATVSVSVAESIQSIVNSVATANFELDMPMLASLPVTPSPAPNGGATVTANRNGSRAFFRAPGLGGPAEASVGADTKTFVCSICSFSCGSKFHYNSHMNTHGDHQCSMCDYTSRTEGRLKKHMRESHTREEQIAAGLDVPPETSITSEANDLASTMNSIMGVVADANRTGISALDSIRDLIEGAGMESENLPEAGPSSQTAADASPTPAPAPRRSGGGKAKSYHCKQCNIVTRSKEDSWRHNKTHIPKEKQLTCTQCEFVTEYKHHLEYHIRNHFGSKPFLCSKCNYKCVNKSMLNSHMKSHSNQYQFQCMDCNYQSKYCHSLKMHLRKYNHRRKPGITIDDADDAIANDPSLEDPGSVQSAFSQNHDANGVNGVAVPLTPTNNNANELAVPTSTPTTEGIVPISSIGSVLLQPITTTTSSSTQYANLLRQRQEQMNEILRATSQAQMQPQAPVPASFSCTMCEFNTSSPDLLIQHNIIHLPQNQPAVPTPNTPFNTLLQYLQHLQNQAPTAPPPVPAGIPTTSLSAFNPSDMLLRVQQQQEAIARIANNTVAPPAPVVSEAPVVKMEVDHPPAPASASSAGSTLNEDRFSTSPMDTKDSVSVGSSNSASSRKRKGKSSKLEAISQRLQGKNSPEQSVPTQDNGIVQPIPISAFHQPFLDRPQPNINYTNNCEHCHIGFGDAALYAIHCGYHGYKNPFKCNRCGEPHSSALEFNLHLMRVKHD